MKNWFTLMYVILSTVILLSSCTEDKSGLQNQQMNLSYSISGTISDADNFPVLIKDFESGLENDTCYDITPQYIRDNSKYVIYKFNGSCNTFLWYDDKMIALGNGWGGYGVTDIKLADVDKDKEYELYFTFSWGSGIHRSQIGYFNPKTEEIVIFDYAHMNEDMMIVSNDKGDLSLYKATISQMDSFVDYTMEADEYIADIIFENDNIALSFSKQ